MRLRHLPIPILLATVLVLGTAAASPAIAGDPEPTARGAIRVGTFDTRAVALAYGRSDGFMEWVRTLKERAEQARTEGDDQLLAQLEAEGQAKQEELHRQVFGGAPIDEILASIEASRPEIAREAQVDLIVRGVLYSGPDVEVVDVSREMTMPFEPDEKTLQILEQLLATPPVEME
jgi:hypothetical protein